VVVNSDILGGPENAQYLVPGDQPANGFVGYINPGFVQRFDPVQVFMRLPFITKCVLFNEGGFTIPQNFPGLPNHQNLPSEERGYEGSTIYFSLLNSISLDAVLQAIAATTGSTVLHAPALTVYSGQRALCMVNDFQPPLDDVKEEFTDSITGVTVNPLGIFTGVTLDVTPTVQSGGTISLELRLGTQALSFFYSTPFTVNQIPADLQVPEVKTSRNHTKIIVPDGETVVVGGIQQQGSQEVEKGIPLLKDVPLVGSLFKGSHFDQEKQTLMILITPRIIRNE